MALAVTFAPVLLTMARRARRAWSGQPLGVFVRRLWEDMRTAAAQGLLSLMLLPFHAWEMAARDHPDAGAAGLHTSSSARMGDRGQRGRCRRGARRPVAAAHVSPARWCRARSSPDSPFIAVAASPTQALARWRCRSFWAGWPRRSSLTGSVSHRAPPARGLRRRASAPFCSDWPARPGTTSRPSSAPTITGCRQTTSRRRRDRAWRDGRRPPTSAWACWRRWPRTIWDSSRPASWSIGSSTRWTRAKDSSVTKAISSTGTTPNHWPRCVPYYVSTVDSGNLVASLVTLASGLDGIAAEPHDRSRLDAAR